MRTQTPGPGTVGCCRAQIQKSQEREYEMFHTKSPHRVMVRSRVRGENDLFQAAQQNSGERLVTRCAKQRTE